METTPERAVTARLFAPLALAGLLAACAGAEVGPTPYEEQQQKPSIFGEGGLQLFGGGKGAEDGAGAAGVSVNAYLWRAALDTIKFMPLASADPFGGVIITDWHSPAETRDERFKVNIVVLTRQLAADGVRARVFKQTLGSGGWTDATVDQQTHADLENAILTRARELRIAAADAG